MQRIDKATRRQRATAPAAITMIALCNGVGVTHLAASKALMVMIGVNLGPVRLPLARLGAVQVAGLRATLNGIGFFDFTGRA